MAKIVGPPDGHATLAGTAGNDQIFASGAGNTIYGGGGNDFISNGTGGYSKVFVGRELDGLTGARDTVRLVGPRNALIGGDETFRAISYGIASSITLGSGNDYVAAYGLRSDITVGLGTNTIIAGPKSSVLVSSPDPGNINNEIYNDTIRYSGIGNSLVIDAVAQRYPIFGTVDVSGGSGSGSFDVSWASGTLATGGRNNVVSATFGTMDIRPGSGGDTVHLQFGVFSMGGASTIHLAGDHNRVDGGARASTITGGTGFTTVALDSGDAGTWASIAVALGGRGNVVSLIGFSGTVDAGAGHDTVTLTNSAVAAVFHGAGDIAFVQDGDVTIDDQSSGLRIKLADEGGTTVIDHFGAARGAVVDLLGSHFTTAAEAFAAVRSDGAGGSMLTFSGSALVHFVGVTNLTAVNFKRLLLGSGVVGPGQGNRAEGIWCASKSGSS